ncbi:indole-3-glycerol phosphate synthase [Actinokineospora alba]|uniref:indole-3-glycerol-phosphate synthase n=1 Tax=Actinokineospora alba TaxID=504798 RepID=A0A1H0M8U4_9PSEU|nr:indole-3-glycerol phosphate synthase [Actinokineospora alba]TDP67626.1 indole-3-glycerol phosphate synthase [Actinokineospora alba]SDI44220.1 indole-3-glycerol phosphate synthase [Actinokineospora alba]SDO76666.1 indole-3-glycerol phosphate synthase [Actinokineospora alba]
MSRFIDTLVTAARPLIMEVKRRDPHGADLMGGRSVAEVVAAYELADAACVSVVTGHWFGGTPDLLREVADLTDKPVLQKDFITRTEHLKRARAGGASAVLLTAGLLSKSSLANLIDAALSLELTPFVEVTDESEVDTIVHPADCVIAVNNKDIKIAERDTADLSRSERMLPALLGAGTLAPVSASGIDTPRTATGLLGIGYAGLLVGTALLRAPSVADWLDEFDNARKLAMEGTSR